MDESKPESVLKIRPTGFDYELDAGCEKKREVKDDFKFLAWNWKSGIAIMWVGIRFSRGGREVKLGV